MGKYDPHEHDQEPILCPREKCRRKNAPMGSDEFSPRCWNCNTFLNVTPVSTGDEVIVDVEDIHQNGSGVGKTDDGYVVLIEGLLPPARAKVEIVNVKPNYSEGELIEKIEEDEDESEDDSDTPSEEGSEEGSEEDEDDDPSLGSRDNHWG